MAEDGLGYKSNSSKRNTDGLVLCDHLFLLSKIYKNFEVESEYK
jgi:hypothetical protein